MTWTPAKKQLPDDERTVLICVPSSDEPVWLGYLDEDGWRYVDGMPVEGKVTHWMELPEMPAMVRASMTPAKVAKGVA
jgi:hypothetical protein